MKILLLKKFHPAQNDEIFFLLVILYLTNIMCTFDMNENIVASNF